MNISIVSGHPTSVLLSFYTVKMKEKSYNVLNLNHHQILRMSNYIYFSVG